MTDQRVLACRIKDYIQPFERELAFRELSRLAAADPRCDRANASQFLIATAASPQMLAERLAYWEEIETSERLTTQVLREATFAVARNGVPLGKLQTVLPFKSSPALPNRRCLRYGPHGLHEYRGKFFPQLVRALVNWAGVRKGGVVADTMCGSGTTIVEAGLLGCTGIGLDLNSLSVFITRTKCHLLQARPSALVNTYESLCDNLRGRRRAAAKQRWLTHLSQRDQEYLRAWFAEDVLRELERIAVCIQMVRPAVHRDLLWVCLSNVLRRVSWQKEDDLRVRRETNPARELHPVKEFLDEVHRSVKTLVAFLLQSGRTDAGKSTTLEGDARTAHVSLKEWKGRIDAVVTSPPYATALPYLDTDRLSLMSRLASAWRSSAT